jgi:hypothetical protein
MSTAASTHLMLELGHAREHGTLEPNDPVPECGCPTCETLAVGGSWSDADHAVEIVQHLALIPPSRRLQMARSADRERREWDLGVAMRLPAPSVLAALAARMPGALRSRPKRGTRKEPLPVEAARAVPLLGLVSRLGLGEPVGRWGEPRVCCPLHDDEHPSLRLNSERGRWYCDPCAVGGDGIRLWELVRGVSFAQAVQEMAP